MYAPVIFQEHLTASKALVVFSECLSDKLLLTCS